MLTKPNLITTKTMKTETMRFVFTSLGTLTARYQTSARMRSTSTEKTGLRLNRTIKRKIRRFATGRCKNKKRYSQSEFTEKASQIGRLKQRERPDLVRKDWNSIKSHVMERVLRAKFAQHRSAQSLLLSTGQKRLVEDSPVDNVWGSGRNNDGQNLLGKALMKLRDELRTSILKDFLVEELERLDEEDLANIEPPQ